MTEYACGGVPFGQGPSVTLAPYPNFCTHSDTTHNFALMHAHVVIKCCTFVHF
jgi:hypothetical protein